MADVAPNHTPAKDITARATGTIIGGRFVRVSANIGTDGMYRVAQSAAAGDEFAVAARDKVNGEAIMCIRQGILPVELGATLAAGAIVCTDAAGRAVAAGANRPVGRLLQDGVLGDFRPVALIGLA
jgi:predicted RecA/RadA family phage recombinase